MNYFILDTNLFAFLKEVGEIKICDFIAETGRKLGDTLLVTSSVLEECGDKKAAPAYVETKFKRFDAAQLDWHSPLLNNLRHVVGGPSDPPDWDQIALAYLIAKGTLSSFPIMPETMVSIVTDDMGIISLLKRPQYIHLPMNSITPYNFLGYLWTYAKGSPDIPPEIAEKLHTLGEASVKKFVFRKVEDTARTDLREYLLEIMNFRENPFQRVSAQRVLGNDITSVDAAAIQGALASPPAPLPARLASLAPIAAVVQAMMETTPVTKYRDQYLQYLALRKQFFPKEPLLVAGLKDIPPAAFDLLDAEILGKLKQYLEELLHAGDFGQASTLLHLFLPSIPAGDLSDYQYFLALLWFIENALNDPDEATSIARRLGETGEGEGTVLHPLARVVLQLEEIIQTTEPAGYFQPFDLFKFGKDFYAAGADVAINLFKAVLNYPDDAGDTTLPNLKKMVAKRLILIARSNPRFAALVDYSRLRLYAESGDRDNLTAKKLDARQQIPEPEPVGRHAIYASDCFYPLSVIDLERRVLVIAWFDPLKARVGLEFPASVDFPRQGVNSVTIVSGTVKTNLAPAMLKEWDIRVKLQFTGDVTLDFDRQTFKFLDAAANGSDA